MLTIQSNLRFLFSTHLTPTLFPFIHPPRFFIPSTPYSHPCFLHNHPTDLSIGEIGVSTPVATAKPEETVPVGPSKLARDEKRLYDGGTKVLHTGGIRKRRDDSGSTSDDDGSPVKNREKRARGRDRGQSERLLGNYCRFKM